MGRIYGRTAAAESAPLEISKDIRAIINRLARGQLQELLTAGEQLKAGSKNNEASVP